MIKSNQLEDSDIRTDTYVVGVVIEYPRRYRAQDQPKSSFKHSK